MDESLKRQRIHAANCSEGTSPSFVKSLVCKIIKNENLKGHVLDFGAGRGELLGSIDALNIFESLSGSDIVERPSHLRSDITWHQGDLNNLLEADRTFDLIICSEVIEHLENPRATFRNIYQLLSPKGCLILTMPNQESIRAYLGLLVGGHFAMFLGDSYPAHITALLRLDIERICQETGFDVPSFYYTNLGGIPKMPQFLWQSVSFGLLKGRLFSDNIAVLTYKK